MKHTIAVINTGKNSLDIIYITDSIIAVPTTKTITQSINKIIVESISFIIQDLN